jgi:hypothetical protein
VIPGHLDGLLPVETPVLPLARALRVQGPNQLQYQLLGSHVMLATANKWRSGRIGMIGYCLSRVLDNTKYGGREEEKRCDRRAIEREGLK